METMKSGLRIFSLTLLATLFTSCASSTMDSVPTVAELEGYERVIRARYQSHYDDLEKRRASGSLSKTEYAEHKRQLDSWVSEKANEAAWQKHFLAESERKADGVPTPDAPVALHPGQATGSVGYFGNSGAVTSFYQPSWRNYGAVVGIGGSAGMGSMQGAREQVKSGQSIRNDAMSSGGTYLSRPPPGSIYDEELRR